MTRLEHVKKLVENSDEIFGLGAWTGQLVESDVFISDHFLMMRRDRMPADIAEVLALRKQEDMRSHERAQQIWDEVMSKTGTKALYLPAWPQPYLADDCETVVTELEARDGSGTIALLRHQVRPADGRSQSDCPVCHRCRRSSHCVPGRQSSRHYPVAHVGNPGQAAGGAD